MQQRLAIPVLAAITAVLIIVGIVMDAQPAAIAAALLAAVVAVMALLTQKVQSKSEEKPAAEPAPEPSKPTMADETKGSAEAEVIAFLGQLQEKGRLIDFLMDDITQHDDAAVGAVARVVYQGCKDALKDQMKISPVETTDEGSKVTVPEGDASSNYRVTGNLSGEPPFSGTLVHKGWKVDSIKLPKVVTTGDALPPIAPAQVEV